MPSLLASQAAGDEEGRTPSAQDQLMVELVNRTRASAEGEAARQGIDLNEGLAAGTLTGDAGEPPAVNLCANQAAFDHSKDLFANSSDLPPGHVGRQVGTRPIA